MHDGIKRAGEKDPMKNKGRIKKYWLWSMINRSFFSLPRSINKFSALNYASRVAWKSQMVRSRSNKRCSDNRWNAATHISREKWQYAQIRNLHITAVNIDPLIKGLYCHGNRFSIECSWCSKRPFWKGQTFTAQSFDGAKPIKHLRLEHEPRHLLRMHAMIRFPFRI